MLDSYSSNNMETKICYKCREEKPLEEFYKNERMLTGYASYCKKCNRITAKEWSEKNKEKVLEKNKKRAEKWRNNNREKANAIQRKFYKKNHKKIEAERRRERENCCPFYIKSMLKRQGFIDSQITPDVIEEKRNIIKVIRIIKQIKNKQNYE